MKGDNSSYYKWVSGMGLLISFSCVALVDINIYEQAVMRGSCLPNDAIIWIKTAYNNSQNIDKKDLFLAPASVGTISIASTTTTGSSIGIVGMQVI